jgi:hypothetical protein
MQTILHIKASTVALPKGKNIITNTFNIAQTMLRLNMKIFTRNDSFGKNYIGSISTTQCVFIVL